MAIQVQVENIKCGGCANTIKNQVSKMDNVESVEVDIEQGIITVDGTIEKSNLIQKLSSLGYPPADENNLISKAKSFVSCAIGRMSD